MRASTGSLWLDRDPDPDARELLPLDRDPPEPPLLFATFLPDPPSVFVALLAIAWISFRTAQPTRGIKVSSVLRECLAFALAGFDRGRGDQEGSGRHEAHGKDPGESGDDLACGTEQARDDQRDRQARE